MKLKLEIKQIENVLLIKVPEDLDFMKLDNTALNNSKLHLSYELHLKDNSVKQILNIPFGISFLSIKEEKGYQTYKFTTEQEATERRMKIEKAIAKYNGSLESKYPFEVGENYWFIGTNGTICNAIWIEHDSVIFRYQNKNTFKTKEECQRKLDIVNFVNENKYEFTKEEWENRNVVKWYLFAYTEDKRLIVDCYTDIKFHNTPYFKDKETAQKVADFIGYDDFMKYC